MALFFCKESILDMVDKYHIEKVCYYIRQRRARLNERHRVTWETALHLAARRGRDADHLFVEMLLDAGAFVNIPNRDGHLPIHIAALSGKSKIAAMLLDAGSRLNKRDKPNKDTPLHLACSKGHHEVVRQLIHAGAYVDLKNKKRMKPLHYACSKGSLQAVEYLIRAGADIHAEDKGSETPLHKACEGGFTHIVNLLLRNGANPNACCDKNETPLHKAAGKGFLDIAALLLERKAKPKARNFKCRKPVDLALVQDRNPVIMILGGGNAPETYYQRVHHFIEQFEQVDYKEFLAIYNKAFFEHRAELLKKRWAIRYFVQTYFKNYNDELPFELFLDLLFKPEALLVRVEEKQGLYLFSKKEERAYRLKQMPAQTDSAIIHSNNDVKQHA